MKAQAEANGLQVLGTAEWLLNDTTFSTQVRDMKRANADIVAISAHPSPPAARSRRWTDRA